MSVEVRALQPRIEQYYYVINWILFYFVERERERAGVGWGQERVGRPVACGVSVALWRCRRAAARVVAGTCKWLVGKLKLKCLRRIYRSIVNFFYSILLFTEPVDGLWRRACVPRFS